MITAYKLVEALAFLGGFCDADASGMCYALYIGRHRGTQGGEARVPIAQPVGMCFVMENV